jgi:hypothetical protein
MGDAERARVVIVIVTVVVEEEDVVIATPVPDERD